MIGFLRVKALDFDTWSNTATVTANDHGINCSEYTFSIPDTNPEWVWARVEDDFIEGDIKTKEEAVAMGMIVNAGGGNG